MALAQYSETNLSASLAVYLAQQLLDAGYVIYWREIDALQSDPATWHYQWTALQATYQADSALQAVLAGAQGMITLLGAETAKRVYPTRHTSDGSAPPAGEVATPFFVVEVDREAPGAFSGLGDRQRERFRTLTVYGCLRTRAEQTQLRDQLTRWFDDAEVVPLLDYDAGTLTEFDQLELQHALTDSAIQGLAPEATRYEVILTTRLRYEA